MNQDGPSGRGIALVRGAAHGFRFDLDDFNERARGAGGPARAELPLAHGADRRADQRTRMCSGRRRRKNQRAGPCSRRSIGPARSKSAERVAASGGALGSERYCACAFSAANSASLRKVMTPIWLDR